MYNEKAVAPSFLPPPHPKSSLICGEDWGRFPQGGSARQAYWFQGRMEIETSAPLSFLKSNSCLFDKSRSLCYNDTPFNDRLGSLQRGLAMLLD